MQLAAQTKDPRTARLSARQKLETVKKLNYR